jgi:hypothetical protein
VTTTAGESRQLTAESAAAIEGVCIFSAFTITATFWLLLTTAVGLLLSFYAADPKAQIGIVLHGLHGAKIKGTAYASQMPPFAQLSDNDIAAIIDHERTSWGNAAPIINPDDVKRARMAR